MYYAPNTRRRHIDFLVTKQLVERIAARNSERVALGYLLARTRPLLLWRAVGRRQVQVHFPIVGHRRIPVYFGGGLTCHALAAQPQ